MTKIIKNIGDNPDIVVIGQSMDGLVAHKLHEYGWNIIQSITVGSPHHGASLLKFVYEWIPKYIIGLAYRPVYEDMKI